MGINYPEIDISNINTVFIDLDDTLYEYEICHDSALSQCMESWASELEGKTALSAQDFKKLYELKRKEVTNRLYPQGVCRSRLLAFLALFEEMEIQPAYVLAKKYDDLYWNSFIKRMVVDNSAYAFLQRAFDEGKKIVIVSDMITEVQIRKIEKLGLKDLIHLLVTSEEAGCEKPSPKIFEYALKKAGSEPAKTIMVGDSQIKDIEGAQALGIKGFLVKKSF